MVPLHETINLDPNEDIVSVFRAHIFKTVIRLIPFVVFLFLLFLFLFPLFHIGPIGVGIFFLLLLVDAICIVRMALMWYATIYIVTTRRLMIVRRRGLFKKEVQEIILEKVSNIAYSKLGIWGTLFNFGDVTFSLKDSGQPSCVAHSIPRPQKMLDVVSKVMYTKHETVIS